MANETDSIDIYDPILTLEGLRIIYEKNRRYGDVVKRRFTTSPTNKCGVPN